MKLYHFTATGVYHKQAISHTALVRAPYLEQASYLFAEANPDMQEWDHLTFTNIELGEEPDVEAQAQRREHVYREILQARKKAKEWEEKAAC